MTVKELNANELLCNLSSRSSNSYIFPALNGNKLTSSYSQSSRVPRYLAPLNFNISGSLSKSLTVESRKQDEQMTDKNPHNSKESSVVENESYIEVKDLFPSETISERTEENVEHSPVIKKPVNTFKIQLENVLPKNLKENKEPILELLSRKHEHVENGKKQQKEKPNGVIIMAPDGTMMKIGKALNEELTGLEEKKKNDPTLYRLFDKIPPYLYYTNKIDGNLDIDNNKGFFFY